VEHLLPTSTDTSDTHWRVNTATHGWNRIDWAELWSYRELLYFLMWKEVKVRYKQTALGVTWAILQPVMTMVVFSVFFGRLAGLGHTTGGIPYPVYVYAGLLPWTFFSGAVNNATNSLVGNSNLITKVYFPRTMIPLATIIAGLVDLAMSTGVFLLLMLYYRVPISWHVIVVPVLLVGTILAASGVGLLFAALTVAYRDFRYVVPFTIQIWMFATPVIYPSSIVPKAWRGILALNPMTGILDGFRWAFLNGRIDWTEIAIAFGVALVLFWIGVGYFRSVERRFADII